MNWADLDKFDEYDRTLPCPNCKELAKPTVAGGNWKCNPCGHLFREDGSKPTMDCTCIKCAPEHDALKGKTKGKKAELQLPDKKKSKKNLDKEIIGHTCFDHPDSDRFCDPDCKKVPVYAKVKTKKKALRRPSAKKNTRSK